MKTLVFLAKILIAALILWLVYDKFDYAQFRHVFTNPWLFALIPLAWAANQLFTTFRLHYLMKTLGRPSRFADILRANMSSLFVGNLMPGIVGADIVKFFYIKKSDSEMKAGQLALVLVIDRVLGLVSILFWCSFFGLFIDAAPASAANPSLKYLALMPVALLACVVTGFAAIYFLSGWVERQNLPQIVKSLNDVCLKLAKTGDRRALALMLASNLLAVLVLLLGLAAVGASLQARATGQGLFAWHLFLIPLVLFASMIPLTPMGIGVAQVTMAGAYEMFGLTPSVGVSISTLSQTGLIIVSLAIGGAVFLAARGELKRLGPEKTGDGG